MMNYAYSDNEALFGRDVDIDLTKQQFGKLRNDLEELKSIGQSYGDAIPAPNKAVPTNTRSAELQNRLEESKKKCDDLTELFEQVADQNRKLKREFESLSKKYHDEFRLLEGQNAGLEGEVDRQGFSRQRTEESWLQTLQETSDAADALKKKADDLEMQYQKQMQRNQKLLEENNSLKNRSFCEVFRDYLCCCRH